MTGTVDSTGVDFTAPLPEPTEQRGFVDIGGGMHDSVTQAAQASVRLKKKLLRRELKAAGLEAIEVLLERTYGDTCANVNDPTLVMLREEHRRRLDVLLHILDNDSEALRRTVDVAEMCVNGFRDIERFAAFNGIRE